MRYIWDRKSDIDLSLIHISVAFTLALHILTLVDVAVLENGLPRSIGLAPFYFTGIDGPVIFERDVYKRQV